MKRKLLFRAGVILMALLPCGASAQIHFTASLDGAQDGGVMLAQACHDGGVRVPITVLEAGRDHEDAQGGRR